MIRVFGSLFIVLIAIGAIIGYVMNIITLLSWSFSTITGELLVRVLGIVIPFVGAVAGYF